MVDLDMDLQAGISQDDSMFGIDNVGLDFTDFEILNGEKDSETKTF